MPFTLNKPEPKRPQTRDLLEAVAQLQHVAIADRRFVAEARRRSLTATDVKAKALIVRARDRERRAERCERVVQWLQNV